MSNRKFKLGSLFDGISGFPIVGKLYDIEPVWASEVEPSCIRIAERHFPNMKQLGDITKIDGSKIEPVDIITGGSPCFPAGTMVLTQNGYIPIEDIQIGDVVLTHKNRWRKVTDVGHKEAPTYKLLGNINLETTAEHPIYSADIKLTYTRKSDGKRGAYKNLINIGEWTQAQYMAGKQWATPKSVDVSCDIAEYAKSEQVCQKPLPKMDRDFWYFVGRWLGDGWVRDNKRPERPNGSGYGTIIICDSIDKESELCKVVSKVSDNFSVEYCKSCVKVKFTSQLLCQFITRNFGKGALNKTIPPWVLSLSEEYRLAIFSGLMDSDGYKVSNNKFKLSSVSKKLILSIRLLAESLGYTTSVSHYKRPATCIIEGRTVNQHDIYTVVMCKNPNRRTGIEYADHKWYKCKSVIATGEVKTVYNISVEEDESYIADSIVVHNCTDLSVAGKQAGIKLVCESCNTSYNFDDKITSCTKCGCELTSTRSGLFMEQIRIIKEMRESTNGAYPKFIIFENVTGLLSSNNGDDFYQVLKEWCGLLGEKLPTLRPPKWFKSGEILGDKGSIAWRTLDAQYWGVPQRRRRIFLVVDFGGERASEILFKSESLRRYPTPSEAPWKRITTKTKSCVGTPDNNNERTTAGGGKVTSTLTASYGTKWNGNSGAFTGDNFVTDVLHTQRIDTTESNISYYGIDQQGGKGGANYTLDVSPTLCSESHGTPHGVAVVKEPMSFEPGVASRVGGHIYEDGKIGTLRANMGDNQMSVVVEKPVYCLQGNGIDRADTAGCNGKGWKEDVCYTLNTIDRPAVVYGVHENQLSDLYIHENLHSSLTTGGGKPGQGYPCVMVENTENKPYVAGFAHQIGGKMPTMPFNEDLSPTLTSHQTMAVLISEEEPKKRVTAIENHPADSRVTISEDNVVQTLSARMGTGGGNVPMIMEENVTSFAESGFTTYSEGVIGTLRASGGHYGGGSESLLVENIDSNSNDKPHMSSGNREIFSGEYRVISKSIVRRLTPLECERLQGFPDNWTVEESDACRYKALGNSVALPCVDYVINGIYEVLMSES